MPITARAAIGVSPEKLDFDLSETNTQKIFIENLNGYPAQILVRVNKNSERIKFSSQQITLPPGTLQDVNVEIIGPRSLADEIEITIYEAGGEQLKIQSGIKIPLTVKGETAPGALAAVILAGIATGVYFVISGRRLSHPPD